MKVKRETRQTIGGNVKGQAGWVGVGRGCWGADGRGGGGLGSGGKEITALSLFFSVSDSSCEWYVTVSDWPTEIGPGPTSVICSANTYTYSNPQKHTLSIIAFTQARCSSKPIRSVNPHY